MRTISNQYYLYMGLAAISILINLFTQILIKLVLISVNASFSDKNLFFGKIGFPYWFILALGLGTVAGFIFKFIVDKFIVFEEKLKGDTKNELEKTTRQLILYFTFAIFTTMIFWGFEIFFKIFLEGDWYLIGGLIGLIIGYTVKFLLDRTFVFTSEA